MKLLDLNPQWWRIYRDRDLTPDNGGFPTDDYELSFRCPTCGPPFIINIKLGLGPPDATLHRWQANCLPDGAAWPNKLTLTPSINHTRCGHGRRKPQCSFHGHIINGEITCV